MGVFVKVAIILKDAPNHADYNKRILEYLKDRHTAINDNNHVITIDVADNSNINQFVLEGVESVPAMKVSPDADEYVYGVNSIIATLAKLEIDEQPRSSEQKRSAEFDDEDQNTNAFYTMAMAEMNSDEQEDPDQPSTMKGYRQDFSEKPISDKQIEEKLQAYSKPYEDRKRKSTSRGPPRQSAPSKQVDKTPSGVDVEKFIQQGSFDKGEELLMRQIAQNL